MKSKLLQLCCMISATFSVLVGAFFSGAALAGDANLRATGPVTMIINYYVSPANRLAWREEMKESGLRQLKSWKEQGVVKNFRVLLNRHVDSSTWDAMIQLTFNNYADVANWEKIERSSPACLTKKALALTDRIETTPVDLSRSTETEAPTQGSVFVVIPFETTLSPAEYLNYADEYIIPQFNGWIDAKILRKYRILQSRYPAGRPWSTLFMLQFSSNEAVGLSDAIAADVRAKLSKNPKWKALANKRGVIEKQAVIADQL